MTQPHPSICKHGYQNGGHIGQQPLLSGDEVSQSSQSWPCVLKIIQKTDTQPHRQLAWLDLCALLAKVKAGKRCWIHRGEVQLLSLTQTHTHTLCKHPTRAYALIWYTLDTHACDRLGQMYVDMLIHMHVSAHAQTHTHLHAHQLVCGSCQRASCLPVSPSVRRLESPLTTHTHTQPFSSSWLLVFGCQLFVRVFGSENFGESARDMKRCDRIIKKWIFRSWRKSKLIKSWSCLPILLSELMLEPPQHPYTHTQTHPYCQCGS